MLDTEMQKLLDKDNMFVSIGVTPDGAAKDVLVVPWERTAHAFSMKKPNVYITPKDLEDETVMALLESRNVVGCYIWTPLRNYDFLLRFPHIRDLSIRHGDAIDNLDFLDTLKECNMLFLENARLKNLDVVVDAKIRTGAPFLCGLSCLALYNCQVDDTSRIVGEKLGFSEFLVWGKKSDRARWTGVSANTWRYYVIEDR